MSPTSGRSIAVLLLAAAGMAQADPVLSIQPASFSVHDGATFSLEVSVANALDLYAFQFDLGFDPTVLSAVDVTEGPFLPMGGATFFVPGSIDDVNGSVSFNADSLIGPVPGVLGSGILAEVEFTAVAPGDSAVSLSNVQMFDSSLNPIDFGTSGGAVSVQAVPEPSSLALMIFVIVLGTGGFWNLQSGVSRALLKRLRYPHNTSMSGESGAAPKKRNSAVRPRRSGQR